MSLNIEPCSENHVSMLFQIVFYSLALQFWMSSRGFKPINVEPPRLVLERPRLRLLPADEPADDRMVCLGLDHIGVWRA